MYFKGQPRWRNFGRFWLPVYGYAAVIFGLSALPATHRVPPIFFADKLLHLLEYAILGYLLGRAAGHSENPGLKAHFRLFAVLVALLYGISDEFHQYFVPGRNVDVLDALADGLGALLGQWRVQRINNA
ncbi:MAG: VanZ family protein [Candidatus Omnitrophota bacterium]